MTVQNNTTGEITELVIKLGLVPYGDELFVGKIDGFPVGVKIISGENPLLLFQIRYPLKPEFKPSVKLDYGAGVNSLIDEKKVEISIEDSIAWLSIIDSESLLRNDSIIQVVKSVLGALKSAGFSASDDICHYCHVKRVDELTCENGKVAKICEVCLDEKWKRKNANDALSPTRKIIGYALVPLASIVGAFGWVIAWLIYDYIVGLLNVRVIVIPEIIEMAVMAIVAVIVGGPVGFVLRKIPQRGDWLAISTVIGFSIASVIIGEILYMVWMIYGKYKIISFPAAVKVLPRFWADIGVIPLLERIGVAAVSVVVAYHFVRPKAKGVLL